MKSEDEAAAGCAMMGIFLIVVFNMVWLSFLGWLIYLLVEWVTSK